MHEYCRQWGLVINTDKSKVMASKERITGINKNKFRFVIGNDDIEYVSQYIEDIQVFGVNMSFISLSEVKIFYIS